MGDEGERKKGLADLASEAYTDVLRPGAKALGEGLVPAGQELAKVGVTMAKAINLALAPVAATVWGWERIQEIILPAVAEKFRDKMERLVQPDPTVAGPTLESMRFAANHPELREMFVSLLAAAMDRELADEAHPAFAEVIRQLTPIEARLLRLINTTIGGLPWLRIRSEIGLRGEILADRLFLSRRADGLPQRYNFDRYFDNIGRLGLTDQERLFKDSSVYRRLYSFPLVEEHRKGPHGTTLFIEEGGEFLTSFGKAFCRICVGEPIPYIGASAEEDPAEPMAEVEQ